MQRGPADEKRSEKIGRRLKTIPSRFVALVVVTILFPLLLVLALATDVVRFAVLRRPFMATRLLAFGWIYLAGEAVAITAFTLSWMASIGPGGAKRLERGTWRAQQAFFVVLVGALKRLFGLTIEVEGHENVEPGPVIVLIRHASIIDNILPSVIIAGPHDLNLRYVIKRELRSDPGLDIGGDLLTNYFVRRGTGADIERENIRMLAQGIGPGEGTLIFPEGTRFTPERRARAIKKLAERDPQLAARAERIVHLLPPKPGGVLAMLDGAPDADVLLLAHAGFDGLRLISDIWRGELIGRRISIRLTRVPRSAIPQDRAACVAWLFDAWEDVDRWVGERLAERDDVPLTP